LIEFVEDLLRCNLIEPSHSAWSSKVLIVRKATNSVRFCCDSRRINNLSVKDAYPLPRIDIDYVWSQWAELISGLAYWTLIRPIGKFL